MLGAIGAIAAAQGGYLTARQAARVGCDGAAIRAGLNRGALVRVHGNLIRVANWPIGPLDEYAKWCALFEGAAVVSHQSAAELYGLGRLRPRFVHLTSARPAPSGLGQVAVRRGHFTSDEIALAGTFGVTTPVRTILDLADTGISQHALDEVVGDALAIGRVEQVHLATAAAERPAPIAARVAAALAETC